MSTNLRLKEEVKESAYRQAVCGPKVLFFSGGTALTALSRQLVNYTHNSIHIISAFDSGGSSAALRCYFDMPAVGDIRSRLIALTDTTQPDCVAVRDLLAYRLSYIGSDLLLLAELKQIAQAEHVLLQAVPSDIKREICAALQAFLAQLPDDFQLRGASIGNLVLAGCFLQNDAPIAAIIERFGAWLGVLGTARLVVDQSYHLAASLADGTQLLGQHLITGKECEPITSPIERLRLSHSASQLNEASPKINQEVADLIASAELICYPPGSFYTSLVATLLPSGVVEAISANAAPKVFIPNMGNDPEQFGLDMLGAVDKLSEYLDAKNIPLSKLLNYIIVDPRIGAAAIASLTQVLEPKQVQLICLADKKDYSDGYYDPDELAKALTTLAVS